MDAGAANEAGDSSGSAEAEASELALALADGVDESAGEGDAVTTGEAEGSADDAAAVSSGVGEAAGVGGASVSAEAEAAGDGEGRKEGVSAGAGVADSSGSTTVSRTFASVLLFTSA